MKATLLQSELNKGLTVVSKAVASRGQLPVLANVLVEAESDGVWFTATNLEIGIRILVGGKVTETGAITVPAKNLSEYVGSLPGETINLVSEGEKLKVSGGKFEGVFMGIAASEFPVIPRLGAGDPPGGGQGRRVKVGKQVVGEVASQVAYAAATDESRPVLTGILVKLVEDNLIFTATDGFRLSRRMIKAEGKKWEELNGLILPARTIQELARITTEGRKEEVEMEVVKGNNQVVFGYGEVQLISRVLEGNFPDIDKIIPAEYKTKVTIDREELMQAVKAGSIFARESNNILKFMVHGSLLKVHATGQQIGEGVVEVEAEVDGDETEMAFNYRYVLDFLGSINEERVVLKTGGPLTPGVWEGEKDKDLLHLIMPVRV